MGLFVSATSMGRDTFDVAASLLRRVRGGLAMATVAANAVFAACTGTSIASASIFTKIAVPEMVRYGHTTGFSVGVVAGSSVLGMLIPPSILFIIFGVIANVSIADLFTSGILPGILLSLAFCATISLLSYFYEPFVFADPHRKHGTYNGPLEGKPAWYIAWKFLPICILVGVVLGGIYGGFFTPTEAGGAGALAAFLIALLRRELTPKIFWEVALETGRVTAAICFLLMAAQLYTQMLTLSGPALRGRPMAAVVGPELPGDPDRLSGRRRDHGLLPGLRIHHVDFAAFCAARDGQLSGQHDLVRADHRDRHRNRPADATPWASRSSWSKPIWTISASPPGRSSRERHPMTLTMVVVLVITVLFPSLSLVLLGQRWSWW